MVQHLLCKQTPPGSNPGTSTNEYLVAYKNWYDDCVQFSTIEAVSGLDAMQQLDGLYNKVNKTSEEAYFEQVSKLGGFIAYEGV